MTRWDDLTPATINQIMFEVREGDADPDDARRVLELFCDCDARDIPPELIRHLQVSFRSYLGGHRRLEAALGLVRRQGRPKTDEELRQAMARAVLELRLQGKPHQECLTCVSEEFGHAESIVGEAWRDEKFNARSQMRLERADGQFPWSRREVERLSEIFKDESEFFAPENSENKPA